MPSHDETVPSWGRYVNEVLGDMNNVEACERMPSISSPNTIGNWRKGTVPSLKILVDFARAFHRSVPEVLAAAGAPIDTPPQGISVRDLPLRELLEIVNEKVEELDGGHHPRVKTKGRRRRRRFTYNPDAPAV